MLTVKDLHKSYQVGKTTYEVLKGVSLTVEKGEFVAVMGPSGSGKTTLLNCISCYIPIDSGEIMLGIGSWQISARTLWQRSATGSWALCSRTSCCWTV